MKKASQIFLVIVYSWFTTSCQDFGKMIFVADLPGSMNEVSGIEFTSDSELLWMVNDSRNKPRVYGYDLSKQKITEEIKFKDATNLDWEDLATHPDGTLFVGDFGNNFSNRQDLTIYWVSKPGELVQDRGSTEKTEAKVTTFYFKDQTEYPPKKKKARRFDTEAFVYYDGYFYLFTRHRNESFNGKTNVYQIIARTGRQIAVKLGSIETCEDSRDCQVTSAAVHEPTGKMALLSYNKVWILSGMNPLGLEDLEVEKIKLGHSSQKESICFKSETLLYIADERSGGRGGNLYSLDLKADPKPKGNP